MKFKRSLKTLGYLSLLAIATESYAVDNLPGSAMPEQVSKALRSEQPAPTPQPTQTENKTEQQATSPLMEQAKKIKFKLNGIVLEGNHVYTTEQLELLYKKQLGKEISVADLFDIVQAITNFYRNNGYIISRALLPPQHVKNGVVHVQIIEGYLGNVTISGTPRGAHNIVLAFGRQIARKRPLEISRMEKYLTLANEVPGTDVKAVLSPSKTLPGAADLTLVTENHVFTGYMSYDNYGTRYIGPQQMTANVAANSFIASGDTGQITYTKTPRGGELTYTDINYSTAYNDEGVRWLLGGTRAHTHPLFVLTSSQVDGVNMNYYGNITYPMIRSRTQTLTTQINVNYLDSNVNRLGNQQLYTDHIRGLGVGASYNFADRWYGANLISGDIRQGLPILGYTSNQDPETARTSRPGGRGDFTKIDLQLSRLQAIYGPWSLYGVFRGQWAFNPLLASEQFSYGGSQMGRGYDVAELIGDKGAGASVELRYDLGIGKMLQSLQLYYFYDGGAVWNFKDLGGVPTKVTALSTGLGTRFYFTKYISGNFMWAQPLTKQVAALQATKQVTMNGSVFNRGNGAAPRVFFSVVAQFD